LLGILRYLGAGDCGNLERKARTRDQNVVLDVSQPMLDGNSDEIPALPGPMMRRRGE
jgi:hypothetical protein